MIARDLSKLFGKESVGVQQCYTCGNGILGALAEDWLAASIAAFQVALVVTTVVRASPTRRNAVGVGSCVA